MLDIPAFSSSSSSTSSPSSATSSATPRNGTPPAHNRLNIFGALGRVNLGSPIVKVFAVVMIGLGAASITTGFGIPAGAALISCGVILLGGSIEASIRTAAAARTHSDGELNVVTFNIGANIEDYRLLCMHNGCEPTKENYHSSQVRAAAFFKGLIQSKQADVILLQEVYDNKILLEALGQEGFEIYRCNQLTMRGEPKDDCAILLHPDRFHVKRVIRARIDGEDAPVVVANDKLTNHIFMFATAHVPGMTLINVNSMAEQAQIGDGYIEKLLPFMERVSTENSVGIQIFGADMNRNPEKWDYPFGLLNDAGFDTHRTGQTTEVFPPQPQYPQRELDFIFSRVRDAVSSMFEKLVGAQQKLPRVTVQTTALMDFEAHGGIPLNQSDHRPVHARFSIIQNYPLVAKQ